MAKTRSATLDKALHRAIRLLAGRAARRVLRAMMHNRTSIFMLHRVHAPQNGVHGHTAAFIREALLELRSSGAKFVPLRALVSRWARGEEVDSDLIAFTMDDGFADQAELARDVFLPMQCPVTVFLITGFLDGTLWPWDDQLAYAFTTASPQTTEVRVGELLLPADLSSTQSRRDSLNLIRNRCKEIPNDDLYVLVKQIAAQLGVSIPVEAPPHFRPMTWQTARELEQLGVEFGPHSVTHRIFSRLPEEESRLELRNSWERLKHELKDPAPIFAWPTGRSCDFAPKDVAIARELGLQACVATESNYAKMGGGASSEALYRIPRFGLPFDVATVLRYGSWLERGRQLLPV